MCGTLFDFSHPPTHHVKLNNTILASSLLFAFRTGKCLICQETAPIIPWSGAMAMYFRFNASAAIIWVLSFIFTQRSGQDVQEIKGVFFTGEQ
jgi:hypothetical protein